MVPDNEDIALLIDDRVLESIDGHVPVRLSEKAQRELDAELEEIDRRARAKRARANEAEG